MKKFKFPLQKVLEYNTHIENKEINILAKIWSEYNELEKQKTQIIQKAEKYKITFLNDCESGTNIVTVLLVTNYIKELEKQIKQLIKKQFEKQAEIEKQTEKLIEVTKSKKTVEKLKENKLKTYKSAERKSEELFIEEFISYINSTAV